MPTEELPLGADDQISVLEHRPDSVNRSNRRLLQSSRPAYGHKISKQSNQKFAVSYVTGSHNFKVGVQIMEGWRHH